jgi:hypothetical protein
VTWLEAGTATVQLDAAITWFHPQSTIEWSVVSQPAGAPEGSIQFNSTTLEDPTVTINYIGKPYVLKVKGTDTTGASSEDTMQIDVYADSCVAAQNILGYRSNVADFNRDCRVNLDDFSVLAANWLEQDFLLEDYLY